MLVRYCAYFKVRYGTYLCTVPLNLGGKIQREKLQKVYFMILKLATENHVFVTGPGLAEK